MDEKPRIIIHDMADVLATPPRQSSREKYGVTWSELCKIEPRLKDMMKRIKAIKDPGDTAWFCANAVWYGNLAGGEDFRNTLYQLVGWDAESKDPRILTSEAFDLAYSKLYDLLPNCRNCNCM